MSTLCPDIVTECKEGGGNVLIPQERNTEGICVPLETVETLCKKKNLQEISVCPAFTSSPPPTNK